MNYEKKKTFENNPILIIFSYLSLCELLEPTRDDSFCASNNKFSLICILDERSRSANELIVVDGGKSCFSSD
jgi:hypothetical protein